jgi:hypothetical protein
MGIDKFWGILDPKSRPRMKTMNPEPLTPNPPFLSEVSKPVVPALSGPIYLNVILLKPLQDEELTFYIE